MKIVISARGDEYEVVATEPMSYEEFMKMYVGLTEWMTGNAQAFKEALGGIKR